ncbi:hypothetical protein L3X38_040620 [Prunus dulcis]|uniref:Uncharacterized protein n=1 Tax=Prunus dulcis TaxID=3755 RepID=A0AAD4VBJ1_PRUDU|nr:hypothetical protein L3X38_040620 [Prunus dulcis]
MDLIGKILSSQQPAALFYYCCHRLFTKWVEAKPIKTTTSQEIITFIERTYHTKAESSNKVIINIIKKMLEKNPKQWHEKLSETLWAYRTSKEKRLA